MMLTMSTSGQQSAEPTQPNNAATRTATLGRTRLRSVTSAVERSLSAPMIPGHYGDLHLLIVADGWLAPVGASSLEPDLLPGDCLVVLGTDTAPVRLSPGGVLRR